MNASRRTGLVLALLTLIAAPALAGSPQRLGTGGGPELRLPVGARSVALSGSVRASSKLHRSTANSLTARPSRLDPRVARALTR